jgi:plasmid maintenance system antidote protein VapI
MKPRSITATLKAAIRESGESLYAIAAASGVKRPSLSKFVRGKQSIRLDMADKLAAYFAIECRQTGRRKG